MDPSSATGQHLTGLANLFRPRSPGRDGEDAGLQQEVAMLLHDQRNLLNGVCGLATLMAERLQPGSPELAYATLLRRLCDDHAALLDDLLQLARVRLSDLPHQPRSFAIRPFAEALFTVHRRPAAAKGLELSWSVDPEVPEHVVADDRRLRPALDNLLANAIRYTRTGSVVLDIQLLAERPGDHCEVLFEVRDTGPGLPDDYRARLGHPFERLGNGNGDDGARDKGIGLGVQAARCMVERLGGLLMLDNAPGGGTAARVLLEVGAVRC